MFKRLLVVLVLASLSACSGAIYRTQGLKGNTPTTISVDARQRFLLSQPDRYWHADTKKFLQDPLFRRFCSEPSPDVFTVLGVAASGGGRLGLGADKSVSAALQGAFSSNETGAAIARTQTANILREMMFRTCERYLSGAISSEEFAIVAARDQRVIVSTLAIEQLTGAVTPPSVAITSSGKAGTGFDPTELVKALQTARKQVTDAEAAVVEAATTAEAADKAAGGCQVLRDNKPTDDDSKAKIDTCNKAEAALEHEQSVLDAAQVAYKGLQTASEQGLGNSSVSVSGGYGLAASAMHAAAVGDVSAAVENIVAFTFNQDETQLFCIRTLYSKTDVQKEISDQCLLYLLTKVEADEAEQAHRLGMTLAESRASRELGVTLARSRFEAAQMFNTCANDANKAPKMQAALTGSAEFGSRTAEIMDKARRGAGDIRWLMVKLGTAAQPSLIKLLSPICS